MNIFALAAGLPALAWLLFGLWNWPWLGWVLVSLPIVFSGSAALTAPLVSVGGLQVFPEDAICTVLLVVAVARRSNIGANLRGRSVPYWAFVGLLLFSLLQGIDEHGPAAVNEFRSFAYFLALVLWVFSLDWDDPVTCRDFDRWVVFVGVALAVAVAIGLSQTGLVAADVYTYTDDGEAITARPVVASQALHLALAGLWAFHRFAADRQKRWLMWALVFWSTSILAQHRSVWAALAAGFLGYLLVAGRGMRAAAGWTLLFTVTAAVMLWLADAARPVISVFAQSFASATETSSTFTGRTFAWQALIEESIAEGKLAVLFGKQFGDGWLRVTPEAVVETYVPHNWYVVVFLRTGLVGLAMLAALLWTLLKRSAKAPVRHPRHFAALILLAVYLFAYAMPAGVAPFIAALILFAYRSGVRSDEASDGQPSATQEPERVP